MYGGCSVTPTTSPHSVSLPSSIRSVFSPSSYDYCSFTACPSTRITLHLLYDPNINLKQTFSIYNPSSSLLYSSVISKGRNASYTIKYHGQWTIFALVADSFGSYIINGVYPSSSRVPTYNPPILEWFQLHSL